ncbi:MAG: 4-hydroxybenzoate octaprenyltransferase [Gammaproteobacteria bacterium]|nr:4-hydroxybenzoate octaprenyltransferase [Gammaproteobacteria bacterium]
MKRKVRLYLELMRFNRPTGTYLLLWPTLWALWIAAAGYPAIKMMVIFVLGTIIMRAAGCVINDFLDHKFDAHVERTRLRPLAAKQISKREAIILFLVLICAALILVLQLNLYCLILAVIAVLLTLFYPLCKRFFAVPQLILGLTFNGVLFAFASEQNHLSLLAWIVYATAFLWAMAYDTQYAMTDQPDDELLGLRSSAIFFGKHVKLFILIFQLLFLVGLILMGCLAKLNQFYWLSLILIAALISYQQKLLRRPGCNAGFNAFKSNNWMGLVIFIGIVLSYLLPN